MEDSRRFLLKQLGCSSLSTLLVFLLFFTALLCLIFLSRSGRRSANVLELVLRSEVPSLSTWLTA